MSDDDIMLDPIADGIPPKYDRVSVVAIVLFLALSAFAVYLGTWFEAVDRVMFAVLVYLLMRQRRAYWLSGYHAVIESIAEQAEYEVPDDG